MFVVPSIMSAVNAQVNAYNQAMAQMNSMAQYQNSLLAQSQPFQPGQMIPCDQYHQPLFDIAPSITELLLDEGETIVDRIAFWAEMPLLGRIIAAKLCDRLDAISDKIAMLLPITALP
jgi:hypothetical protein